MGALFRYLLEPTPTVPLRGHRKDTRPWREQVVSGFLLAGRLIVGFLVMGLAIAGLMWWVAAPDPHAPLAFLVGWWTLPSAVIIMLFTAHRWAPFSIGFFLVPGIFRSLGFLVVGPNPNSPIIAETITRLEALETLAYCVITVGLTWRFLRNRPAPTTFLDRCGLTFFAVASFAQVLQPNRFYPRLLILGLTALLLAWIAYRLRERDRLPKS